MKATHYVRRWPLFLIAAPAAVAVWSGWGGLGTLCGFGLVHPLPGIVSGFTINTAITLPVGVEAYGAYALGAWLTPGTPAGATGFARNSSVGALLLGMLGQVAYHLLAAAHATRAPWPVVIAVSCLPVMTLGCGAALTHLLRVPVELAEISQNADETGSAKGPETGAGAVPAFVAADAESAAMAALRASIAGGNPLSLNKLMTNFKLTRTQATKVRNTVLDEFSGQDTAEADADAA
jgi:hypothetical protein